MSKSSYRARRIQNRQFLDESEECYSSLFENLLSGLVYCRMIYESGLPADFIYLDVNHSYENASVLKNVAGKKNSELDPEFRASNPEMLEIYARVAISGRPEKFEAYVKYLEAWCSVSVYCPKKDHFVAIFDDIGERKKAEEELKTALLYNRNLIEASLDPLITTDPQGKIIDANKATEEITGISREHLIATDFSDYFTEPAKARQGYQRVLAQDHVRDYHLNMKNRNGKITPILYNASVFYDQAGKRQGVFAAARDMTEYKKIEQKLLRASLEQERLDSELQVAKQIQLSVIPQQFPKIPNAEIYAKTLPAREVGGDFYDFWFIDPEHLCFAIGDASGKGVPAALFTAVSHAFLRATLICGEEPGECLSTINRLLVKETDPVMFITLFYGILNFKSGEFFYSNAGHNPPVMINEDGSYDMLPLGGQLPLAVERNTKYQTSRHKFPKGLFLYSDGLIDAMDQHGNRFSEDRVLCTLSRLKPFSPEKAVNKTLHEVEKHAFQTPQYDDITLFAIKYLGQVA